MDKLPCSCDERGIFALKVQTPPSSGMEAAGQGTRQGAGLQYKWIVAMVVIIGVFMAILDSTIVNIAIPRLQSVFGADLHSVQWVLTAYILAQGVATPAAAF